MPVGLSEKEHQQVADDGEGQADLDAVLGRECLGREGEDALRRVNRQDEAEAHDELQDHGDADDVQRIVAESLQNGNHDRDHGGSDGRCTRKAKVYDNEEQGEDGKDHKDAQAGQPEDVHELVGEPGGGLRREQGAAHADADAEEDQRAPGDARLRFLPVHDADTRQQHKRDGDDRRRRRVERMQRLLGHPEEQQRKRDDHEFFL